MKRDCLICSYLQFQAQAMTIPFAESLIATACATIGACERYGVQRVIKSLCLPHRTALAEVQKGAAAALDRRYDSTD